MALRNRIFYLSYVILLFAASAFSQDKYRSLDEHGPNKYLKNQPPIEIVDRKIGSKGFSKDEKVLSSRDWLEELRLTVRNKSEKNIVHIFLYLLVAKSPTMNRRVPIPVVFGIPNQVDGQNTRDLSSPARGLLRPGETTILKTEKRSLDALLHYVEKLGITDIETVGVEFHTVEFDDGSGWTYGTSWESKSDGTTRITQPNDQLSAPAECDADFNL
jgi:hypothetical protein